MWHVFKTGFQIVPYFKVTFYPRYQKIMLSLSFFLKFSIQYTETNLRDFIQILHVYVTFKFLQDTKMFTGQTISQK